MFLDNDFVFEKQYVRTRVIMFTKGERDLYDLHEDVMQDQEVVNGTIYDVDLPGDPIINFLEISDEEIETLREEAEANGETFEMPEMKA